MNRELLVASLKVYNTSDDEKLFIPRFLDLLRHPNAFQRDHLPGHITGSAWIVDSTRNFVLLTHHAKLNRWLQPGGHADGDENIVNVALREAVEETGLKDLKLLNNEVFDVDIHTIPRRNEFPEHLHYDVRFILEGNRNHPLQLSAESHALQWVSFDQLKSITKENSSILRMADKARLLF